MLVTRYLLLVTGCLVGGLWRSELERADRHEHGDLLPRRVLRRGAGAAGAGLVAGPLLDRVDEQARLPQGFDVRLDRLVERPGVLAGVLAGMGGDRALARDEVAVDPAVLHLVPLVPAPARFL